MYVVNILIEWMREFLSSPPKLAGEPSKNGGVPTQVGGERERKRGYNEVEWEKYTRRIFL